MDDTLNAVGLRQIQRCISDQPFAVFMVPSKSRKGLIYDVYSIDPDDPPEEYICQCESFCYRGRCGHQDEAHADRCLWNELTGPEQQSEMQQLTLTCPRCQGETYLTTEWME